MGRDQIQSGQGASVRVPTLSRKFDGRTDEFEWQQEVSTAWKHKVDLLAADLGGRIIAGGEIIDIVSSVPRLEALTNAASLSPDAVCSPDSIASLYGSGFEPASDSSHQGSVRVNGQKAPMLTVSPSRIWFQCPDLSPGTALEIMVETPAGISNELHTTMREATPGVFTMNDSGRGQGSVLMAGTGSFVILRNLYVPGYPAQPGDVVTILATGLGRRMGDTAIMKPFVRVTGIPAEVLAVRLNDLPGLYEVDVRIPQSAQIGEAGTVVLEAPGLDGSVNVSNTVTIAIQEKR